ncbi:MAG TPA: retropepsin-like aspartic protease [Flavitalea sp.]|nr:retropepsin-like aspartic protease [Flavitalea sp.]
MKPFIKVPDRAGKYLGLFIPLLLLGSLITAQPKLIKANSNKVDIKDGDYFQKEVWNLSPEINPDIYYVIGPVKEKKIIFYTDIDSINVNMQPGRSYDFIILLNGKDSCFTRLVWQSPTKNSGYKKNCRNCIITSDTIPFTLAEDDRIHIKGKINNSHDLDLVFDTGAYGIILSTRGLEKVDIHFDGTARGMGFGGNSTVRSSSSNILEIGGLIWDSVPLVHNAREALDGVVGYRIFDNKIVEIDYNKRLIIAHAAPIEIDPLYTKLDMELRNQLPFIKTTLLIGNTSITDWFCYDSGNSGTINLDDDFSRKYN